MYKSNHIMINSFLVIGHGARENAIIKSLLKNNFNSYKTVYCIGNRCNPGIYNILKDNFVVGNIMDFDFIREFCIEKKLKIVIVGPEQPLSEGIVDYLQDICYCIGPTSDLSKIESSKAYARQLLDTTTKLKEYSADWIKINVFNTLNIEDNLIKCYRFITKYNNEVVVKQDGLAGGKGVKVWGVHFTKKSELVNCVNDYIINKIPFIIEEKFIGKEFSLLTITDGTGSIHGPPIMDFKLLYDGDIGPNTGSMGSILDSKGLEFITDFTISEASEINENVIRKLNMLNDTDYTGILYGSFILTKRGLKVIEFNCRFGDPEGVLLLNQLNTSFAKICNWIVSKNIVRNLDNIEWKKTNSMCKYLVTDKYPIKYPGHCVFNLDSSILSHKLYYGSGLFKLEDNKLGLINSSRGLLVLEEGDNLNLVEKSINDKMEKIISMNPSIKLHYRKTLFKQYYKAIEFVDNMMMQTTYLDSGVDIDSVTESLKNSSGMIKSTHNKYVLSGLTSFGGMFSLEYIKDAKIKNPILVSSTDGVGTKTSFVEKYFGPVGYKILGQDLVNHCINDILVQGAKPLFFLDYFASSKFPEDVFKYFLEGVTKSCNKYGCALLGGETAEMPGIYKDGKCDVVGTIVGILDRENIISGKKIIKDDIVMAIPSSGLHTNGFSLIRNIYKHKKLSIEFAKNLSNPHRCYLNEIETLLKNDVPINGLCHITGGGLIDNPERIIPKFLAIDYCDDFIESMPSIYHKIKEDGAMDILELMRVLNCGVGMMVILPKMFKHDVMKLIPDSYYIGKIVTKL